MAGQQRRFITNNGADLVSMGTNFLQMGIGINNPSPSWLKVTPIDKYVPPYTLGWYADVIPGSQGLSVLYVDSPSGSHSSGVDGEIEVTLYDTPQGNSQGFPSGALAQQGITGYNYQFWTSVPTANETARTQFVFSLTLDTRTVVVGLIMTYPDNLTSPRGLVYFYWQAYWEWGGPGLSITMPLIPQTISPESPHNQIVLPPGVIAINANRDDFGVNTLRQIQGTLVTQAGAGAQRVSLTAIYYEESLVV